MLATTLLPLLPQKRESASSRPLTRPTPSPSSLPLSFSPHEWQTEIKLFLLPRIARRGGGGGKTYLPRCDLHSCRRRPLPLPPLVVRPSLSCGFCGQQRAATEVSPEKSSANGPRARRGGRTLHSIHFELKKYREEERELP